MKKIFKLAQENGWVDNREVCTGDRACVDVDERAYLDPLFFQALGKALGWWIDIQELKCKECDFKATNDKYVFCPKDSSRLERIESPVHNSRSHWRSNWHDFIDHLAEGKDAESFFNELLALTKIM